MRILRLRYHRKRESGLRFQEGLASLTTMVSTLVTRGPVSQKAEDRSRRCVPSAEADAGGSLSANLGTKSGKPGSAATAVASASFGADAHANHESVASPRDERGQALEEKVVERTGPSAVREPSVGILGQPAAARVAGTTGSHESDHRRANCSCRARSQETA